MWWRDGVLYQSYPRSFADSDGDGVGDLRGIRARLDHLEWLGIDGLWLNPTFPSPNRDWGFDVSDYRGVHPELGTLEDLDALVADARGRGIHVLLDLVPNHTSDQHPWFRERPELYVWAPGRDGGPPNNWRSEFEGSSWTYDERRDAWYLHNFLPHQPDLDWWNPEVADEFDDILRFWFDRGIAGFRIDVAHGIVKDRELRDNPPAQPGDPPHTIRVGQRRVFSQNRPEVHDVHKRWRALTDLEDPPRVLVGETWVETLEDWVRFYGTGDDQLHLAFNFVFTDQSLDAEALAEVVERTEQLLPGEAWPVWTLSNHDMPRFPTRWAGGDPRRVRLCLLALLALRGTPVLYYGDELGMPEADVPEERWLDPTPLRRDGARTPMIWTDEPGHGFTERGVEPWLPFGAGTVSVAAQREDPGSHLHLVRDLIALRRERPDLSRGGFAAVHDVPAGAWAWKRGGRLLVALNLSDAGVELGASGTVLVGTDRGRDGEVVDGALRLGAWEGAVVELREP